MIPLRRDAATFAATTSSDLAEEAPALGMPDLGDAHTDLEELGRADFSGVGAVVPCRDVLRAHEDARAAEGLDSGEHLQVRRDHEELDAAVGDGGMPRRELGDAGEPSARVDMPEVHLQAHPDRHARGHQQDPVVSYSPMTATFSADAEVGSKR